MTLSDVDAFVDTILGSNKDRADELYRYLTAVKFMDLEREDFDRLFALAHNPERFGSIDMFLNAKIPVPKDGVLDRRYWFEQQRATYLTMFQSMNIEDIGSQYLKYRYIKMATEFAKTRMPHKNPEDLKIFVHGAGIGDDVVFFAQQGYNNVHYNDIGGSETTKFALKRLEAGGYINVPKAPVRMSFDPLGRGIYENRAPYAESLETFDLIVSCNVFGWIKHAMYTIFNLGKLMVETGVLAIIPSWENFPLESNEWMIPTNIYSTFMEHMGFVGHQLPYLGSPYTQDFYPVFTSLWGSHQKYKEEWIL
jgi:hypothetical protein